MSKVEEYIWKLAEPIVQENQLELVDVEFVKEGADWYLRLYLDKETETGIELEDCELVSRQLSQQLEENDPIEQAYHLEVSSPGIERPLKRMKDFVRFQGKKIHVKTFKPLDGKKEWIGILGEVTDESLNLGIDGQNKEIPRESISKVNLVWEF